jgi:hypothetical protein
MVLLVSWNRTKGAAEDGTPAAGEDAVQKTDEERHEHPAVKAMKAADSLDRETAELQIEEDAVDDNDSEITPIKERDVKIPSIETDQETPEVTEKNEPWSNVDGDNIVTTVLTAPIHSDNTHLSSNRFGASDLSHHSAAASVMTELLSPRELDDDEDPDLLSPTDEAFHQDVTYSEAYVVNVQALSSPKILLRRTKSFDLGQSSRRLSVSSLRGEIEHTKSAGQLYRSESSRGRLQSSGKLPTFLASPTTGFVRASKTTIKKLPSFSVLRTDTKAGCSVYVDRGTNTTGESVEFEEPADTVPFEPVFAVVEDLVIYFSYQTSNKIFDTVLQSYKDGSYPILPLVEEVDPPSGPAPDIEAEEPPARPASQFTSETDDDGFHRRHEFDPYADDNYPLTGKQWPPAEKQIRANSVTQNVEPPSPTLTPPPTTEEAGGFSEKFTDFSPDNTDNVIEIQNSLRSLLAVHFPAGEEGHTQMHSSISPETDRLWKPVFGNDESSKTGHESRTVDEIIAFGSEEGVNKDFFSQLSGQIEKLGNKRDGTNRGGKVELRYAI